MFSLAYAILPFSDMPPETAIKESLARFQRGQPGDVPEDWIAFEDLTAELQGAYEASFMIELTGNGLSFTEPYMNYWYLDSNKVRSEMLLRNIESWHVRFADLMDLDTFFNRFGARAVRHPETGRYGLWLNPLGRWDWWDLGGRFDGRIIRDSSKTEGRRSSKLSSGPNRGRKILSNLEDALDDALGEHPRSEIDVSNDCNIELAETVLLNVKADPEHECPGALVLPPSSFEDHLRWLQVWPELRPVEAFKRLGLSPDASWPEIVERSCQLFRDHWVAAIAYHH